MIEIWTDGGLGYMGAMGRERGSGESKAERTVTDAISSSPPSKGVTPVIMWIKWQKTGHACPPRHGLGPAGGACARVARLCPFLSFSI